MNIGTHTICVHVKKGVKGSILDSWFTEFIHRCRKPKIANKHILHCFLLFCFTELSTQRRGALFHRGLPNILEGCKEVERCRCRCRWRGRRGWWRWCDTERERELESILIPFLQSVEQIWRDRGGSGDGDEDGDAEADGSSAEKK